jgi:pilus assembly protein TadC
MLDTVTFAAGLLSFLGGLLLLYYGFYDWSANQSAFVIIGAGLFALGLLTVSHVARKRWQWKKQFKNDE